MCRSILTIASLSLCTAAPALAQAGPAADRSIAAVLVDPGPPGASQVDYFIKFDGVDGATAPMDLSAQILLFVNGTPVSSRTIGLTQQPTGGCSGLGCEPGEPCLCTDPPVVCECGPSTIIVESFPEPVQPGDEITVLLMPAPGAVPDPDSTNNSYSTTVATDRFWNRRITGATAVPASAGGDSFFDIFTEISLEARYDGELDLSTIVQVLVNGVVVAESAALDLVIGFSPCECGDDCAPQWQGACVAGGTSGDCACGINISVVVPRVHVDPDDELIVALVPTPDALPELPPFEEDDEHGAELPRVCEADLDGNLIVDFNDLLLMLTSWGPCAGCTADLDGDDMVGFNDLLMLLASWGPCFPV